MFEFAQGAHHGQSIVDVDGIRVGRYSVEVYRYCQRFKEMTMLEIQDRCEIRVYANDVSCGREMNIMKSATYDPETMTRIG